MAFCPAPFFLGSSVNIERVREYCMSLPQATESLQWGDDLVFKIGGKMFAVLVLKPAPVWLSFKCTPEEFAELTERPGVIPAPYSARYYWVALETEEALGENELRRLVRNSYQQVLETLPRRTRLALGEGPRPKAKTKSTDKRRPRRKAR